jgi:VWFA-related protein
MRTNSLLGCAVVTLAIVAVNAQTPPPVLVLQSPVSDTVLKGPVTFAAEVNPPEVSVREVVVFVNGQRACSVRVRPFECSWDAGAPVERSIRVVAELSNGQRLVTTARTRAAEQSTTIFRGTTNAVVVQARVTDGRGRVIPGLTAESFRLLEDGVPQTIDTVLQGDAPASILLCLDASSSMTPVLSELKRAAAGFLNRLRPQDTVGLAVFNTGFYVLARPGTSAPERTASLERIRPIGGTALFDSMVKAVALMRTMPSPRAVVVFTDGVDSASRASADTVRAAFQANDIVLYLVVQGDGMRQPSGGPLGRLAEETGGAAWFAPRMSSLGDQFAGIISDLVNRYVLVYSPQRPLGDDAWRRITVELTGRSGDYAVRAREGYVASRRDGDGR